MCDIGYGIDQYAITVVTTGTNPYNGCLMKSQIIKQYEDNNCNGQSNPGGVYKRGQEAPRYRVQSGAVTSLGNNYYRIPLVAIASKERYNEGAASTGWKCKTEEIGTTRQYSLVAYVNPSDSTNNCPYTTDKSCKNCAWPYLAKADSLGCGCRIDYSAYQPKRDLELYAYAYCQTAGNDGTQYYLDQSRSNFDATRGEIIGACSSPSAGVTLYIPAATCPAPRIDTTLTDTAQQTPLTPIPRPTLGGSGGGSGSDTGTHSRLDTILGTLRDTAGIGNKLDTLRSWDSAFGDAMGDTVGARDALRDLDSSIASLPGADGPCAGCVDPWRCDRIPNDSVVFDLVGHHFSIPLSFSDVVSRLPFDFWAVLRLLEWLVVTLLMLGPWLWIAGANVGKGGS